MITLITILFVISGLHQLEKPSGYDDDFYAYYEDKFKELSEQALREDSLIAAQHYPQAPPESGTNAGEDALAKQSNAGSKAAEVSADTTESERDTINVNTADATRLQELPGVGAAIAERIVEYREENGPFEEISDLRNVRGIGEARLENIRPYVTLE